MLCTVFEDLEIISRFLFNAEEENLDYVVPLDPELIENAMKEIEKNRSHR